MDYNDYIKTYEDLAKQVGGMVLANAHRFHHISQTSILCQ